VPSTVARANVRVRKMGRRARLVVHRRVLQVPQRVACTVCTWSGSRFAADAHGRKDRLCPSCGSSERDRALALELRRRGPVASGVRLLEVAPIGLVERIAEELGYEHHSVDLFSPRAEVRADLCSLPFADGSIDLAVCFHVLEHIPEDRAAARELARVLRPGGEALVVVPFASTWPETFEDPDTPPEDRERVYGQSDHVRIYGTDVTARWREAGVAVDESVWTDRFTPDEHASARITGHDDRFWILRPS